MKKKQWPQRVLRASHHPIVSGVVLLIIAAVSTGVIKVISGSGGGSGALGSSNAGSGGSLLSSAHVSSFATTEPHGRTEVISLHGTAFGLTQDEGVFAEARLRGTTNTRRESGPLRVDSKGNWHAKLIFTLPDYGVDAGAVVLLGQPALGVVGGGGPVDFSRSRREFEREGPKAPSVVASSSPVRSSGQH